MASLLVLLLATQAWAQTAPKTAAKTPAQTAAPIASPSFPDPGKTSMSKENQRALGKQAADQVYQQMPVLPDNSPETQYIRELGSKLVNTIPEQYSWPFEFHVIPQKDINAFALPGGQMFINLGTLNAARSEAELAGVMGHEMAHVYMQHSAKQAGKAQTTSMLAGIAGAVLGGVAGGGMLGQLGQMGIQMGAQGMVTKYSRNDETQADQVGALILYNAGYNPQAMVDFFATMGAQAGAAPPELFSSHPNPGNRQKAIEKLISSWPPDKYVADTGNFAQIHQQAQQVRVYSAAEIEQGAKSGQWASFNQGNRGGGAQQSTGASTFRTRGSADPPASTNSVMLEKVLPSRRMASADLGPLKIQHPENWPVTLPEQQGQFVTIAPQAGITKDGVGYGVLLNGAPAPGQRMSIDDMTASLIQQIQQKNQLEQLGKPQPITVGRIEGRATMLRSASPFPDASGQAMAERDLLITVPMRDGSLVFMIFVAAEPDFDHLKPTFEAMLNSVQFK